VSARASRAPSPLVRRITRRLVAIAAAVLVATVTAVGLYYTRDPSYLFEEAVQRRMARLEAALVPRPGAALTLDPATRALFERHPDAYAFALLDADGEVLDGANLHLLPTPARETGMFASDWIARPEDAPGTIVASHRVGGPDRYLRLVFVATADPANLVRNALLRELAGHALLPLAPAVLILLAANALMIRRSLAPLAAAAAWARRIRPGAPVPPSPPGSTALEIGDLVFAARAALERLSEALEGERRRAAEAAHALRTPVAVLTARLDTFPEGPAAAQLRADVAALARMVGQVLNSASAEMVTIGEGEAVDLALVAEEAVATLAPFGFDKGVPLELDVHPGAEPALGNARAIGLALDNLVENAILHGRGAARVRVGPGPTLTVEDDGPGLPPGDRAQLFAPFRRGPAAPPGGAGLGLAIVARIQRAHGGTVEAGDAAGGGARVTLTFRSAAGGSLRARQVRVSQAP
jgi:two-component system OmpR family sensor kinase